MYVIYCFLIFLSGISALIYQVVWSRLFAGVFGVTAYAVTAVLVTFLGGLALGALILGKKADYTSKPLQFFGKLEIGTVAASLFGVWLLGVLDPLHMFLANQLEPASAALMVVRMLLASLVLFPSTFLMGGTLPAIVRVSINDLRQIGNRLSLLYALNTLGALTGSLIAGFLLIRLYGLHVTVIIAAGLNAAVGMAAFLLALKQQKASVLNMGLLIQKKGH